GWLIVQLAERDNAPQLVPVYLGLVGLARGVPVLFAGLAAGVIADRVDRRRLLMIVQVYWAIVSIILAWLTLTDRITIGLVLWLTMLSAIAQAFDGATRQTVFPRLVPRRAWVSAVGLNSMSFNVAQFIGPMIGGFLIGPIGVGGLMVLNALSFLALIYAIFSSSPMPSVSDGRPAVSPLRSLQESFSFVWRDPTVGWAMLLGLLGNVLARPFQLLFPAFVHDALRGDARDLSYIMTAAGIGALSGAFGTASLGALRRRGVVFSGAGIVLGGLLVAFGLQQSLWPAVMLAYCVSFASQLFVTMGSALYHTHTPDELRGRVMGLSTVVVQGGMSMGALVVGSLGAVIGIGAALAVGGGVFAASSAAALARVPALREEGTRPPPSSAAVQPARMRAS
ncbi:MAG TPA: MFS transporter, partial [Chloroflexota bacterium]|nr:MFS transporter [Chloroflexota bacterium]